MLHAQFPTQETRHALRDSLIEKAVAEISDPFSSIMVVRDSSESSKSSDSPAKEEDEIISFAKWGLPVPVGVEYKEPEWNWPVGTEMGVLGAWSRRVEEVTAGVLGGEQEWYRMFSFLVWLS